MVSCQHFGQGHLVVGARVAAHQRVVPLPGGRIQAAQVAGAAHRHPAGPVLRRVHALRMEEVLLEVLVGPQGDHVEHPGGGDLPDPVHRRGQFGPPEVVPQQGPGRRLVAPGHQRLRPGLLGGPPPRRTGTPRRWARPGRRRPPQRAPSGRPPRRPPGCPRTPGAVRPGRRRRGPPAAGEQALRRPRGEAIGQRQQVGVPGGILHHPRHRHRRPQELGAVARPAGGGQEVEDPGGVHAVAQGGADHQRALGHSAPRLGDPADLAGLRPARPRLSSVRPRVQKFVSIMRPASRMSASMARRRAQRPSPPRPWGPGSSARPPGCSGAPGWRER